MGISSHPIVPLTPEQRQMVEANLSLVRWILNRRELHRIVAMFPCRDDSFQTAAAGLCRAVQTFDQSKGKFATWAMWWMRQALQRAACDQRGVRIPPHRQKEFGRFSLGLIGLPEKPDGNGLYDIDLLGVDDGTAEEVAAQDEAADRLGEMLKCLPGRDREIMAHFARGHTTTEVGQTFGFSRERARQIYVRCLAKLRERYARRPVAC